MTVQQQLTMVTNNLPGGGEVRAGQLQMAERVSEPLNERVPLLVEAGTGTGKLLAYLTPIVAEGCQAVIATATIALQTQLVESDVPLVAAGLKEPVAAALLKGRRNYLCKQRLDELERAKRAEQLQLLGGRNRHHHLEDVVAWAATIVEGDREELDPAPPADAWSTVSVGADECPGAARCPSGDQCFSKLARQRAMAADVIVNNHHYYGLNIASAGALLPEHDVVVFDEAHQLPEVLGATCGTEVSGGRFRALGRRVTAVLTDDELPLQLDNSAADFDDLLGNLTGTSITDLGDLVSALVSGRDRAGRVIAALRKLNPSEGSDIAARIERTMLVSTRLVADIDSILEAEPSDVLWVDGSPTYPVLRRTPLELEELLKDNLFNDRTVFMTSATLSDGIVGQLGLSPTTDVARVGSPFTYETASLLYCSTDMPEPRMDRQRGVVQDEIITLVGGAGGRALCLFTSFGAMAEATERFESKLDNPILVQGEAPKGVLIERFKADPSAILLAALSFWQGIDLPGSKLTLVTIDRLPFPRPDEPIVQAKRDRAGRMAFREADLPRAQTLLAQAAGRL